MKNVTLVVTMCNDIYYLPSFLEGNKDAFAECIFVDGGEEGKSTDGSIELIEQAGHKVYQKEFNYDMAGMKNHGLNLAKTKWRMVLDTDEIMSQGLKKLIVEFNEDLASSASPPIYYSFFRDTYMDGGVIDTTPLEFPIRLFDDKVFYRSPSGTVHEQPIFPGTVNVLKFVLIEEVFKNSNFTNNGVLSVSLGRGTGWGT